MVSKSESIAETDTGTTTRHEIVDTNLSEGRQQEAFRAIVRAQASLL